MQLGELSFVLSDLVILDDLNSALAWAGYCCA